MSRAAVIIAMVCVGAVALGGTYGGVSHNHRGYSAGVDCSVGSWSDHAAEGRAFDECKKRAELELVEREPSLAQMYRHFTGGAHGRRRLLSRLAQTANEGDWEHSVKVEIAFPQSLDELAPAGRPMSLSLFVNDPATPSTRILLAVDFAVSQLAAGGLLAQVLERRPRDLSDTQQLLTNCGSMARSQPFALMRLVAERRGEIAELAQRSEPLAKKYQWQGDQRSALVEARAIDAFVRGRPYDDDLYRALAKLDAAPRSDALLLMVLLEPESISRVIPLAEKDQAAELRELAP